MIGLLLRYPYPNQYPYPHSSSSSSFSSTCMTLLVKASLLLSLALVLQTPHGCHGGSAASHSWTRFSPSLKMMKGTRRAAARQRRRHHQQEEQGNDTAGQLLLVASTTNRKRFQPQNKEQKDVGVLMTSVGVPSTQEPQESTPSSDRTTDTGGASSTAAASTANSMWPPWPLNLLTKPKRNKHASLSSPASTDNSGGSSTTSSSRIIQQTTMTETGAQLMARYTRQSALTGLRQLQQVGSALVFHVPPAAPPIFLLALLPSRITTMTATAASAASAAANTVASSTSGTTTNNILTRVPNTLARKVAWITLGMTILSWADYEIGKKRRLTPLPLLSSSFVLVSGTSSGSSRGGGAGTGANFVHEKILNVQRVTRDDLPPFLPEDLPPLEHDPLFQHTTPKQEESSMSEQDTEPERKNDNEGEEEDDHHQDFQSHMKRNISSWYKVAASQPETLASMAQSWKRMNRLRHRQIEHVKREEVVHELKAWQERIKRQKKRSRQWGASTTASAARSYFRSRLERDHGGTSTSSTAGGGMGESTSSTPPILPMGYALVTGASRGIGRALAVELARWEVPLILVARDIQKLTSLAQELEEYYGIHCCAIEADLSKPDTAKKLYETTKGAGLRVDILVNNAGACSQGRTMVEDSDEAIQRMIDINVGSVTRLSHLYGRDMKENRRGRILFLSSVTGAVASGPTIATYAATKAYEKSLALSLGKEMEPFGVGVTCIMPGATKTNFASNSQLEDAICFKTPFYPMAAKDVASRGIRALLSGDAEVVPGWHNRAFVKLLTPMIPQRCSAAIVEFFFNPLELRLPTMPWSKVVTLPLPNQDDLLRRNVNANGKNPPPPRILKLPSTAPTSIAENNHNVQNDEEDGHDNSIESIEDDKAMKPIPAGNDSNVTIDTLL